MFYVLSVINLTVIFLLLLMLLMVLFQKSSREQLAFVLFDLFVIIFILGLHLELLYSDTVDAALSGLTVQYFGQCGFLISILWFVEEFVKVKIPRGVYILHGVISSVVMTGILTAKHHTLFYTSMEIITEGMYPRISCSDGIIWWVHYIYFFAVFIAGIVLCVSRYRKGSQIQKKRILYLTVGLSILLLELILKVLGVFGSYNPIGIALLLFMFCLMVALIRYSYFNSLSAAMDNALNHGEEGLVILDTENEVVFFNEKAKRIFPLLWVGEPLAEQKEIVEILRRENSVYRNQDEVWEFRMETILENDEKAGSMLYMLNVTEHVRQSEELKNANEKKTQFLVKVSHELRTPLNIILGMNEMIVQENRDPQIAEYANMIQDGGNNMLAIIEEIVHISQIENESIVLKEDLFSLKKSLMQLKMVYSRQAVEKSLSFTVKWDGIEVETHEELELFGDGRRVLQILMNLLSNAFKYTAKGSVSLEVQTDGVWDNGRTDPCIRYTIIDTGNGIARDEQEIIFDKFTRGIQALLGDQDGLGLGLSIVRGFTEAMEGSISLESEVNHGSRFTVCIPRKDPPQTEKKLTEALEGERILNGEAADKRLLIVDDYSQNLLVITHLLKHTGLIFDTTQSGEEAVTMCEKSSYDLLLIDYLMPHMDGTEVLYHIRNDKNSKNHFTPAIMISANEANDARERYLRAGCIDYIFKPVQPGLLRSKLQRYLLEEPPRQLLHRLEEAGISVMEGLAYADDDVDFYEQLLKNFANDFPVKKERLCLRYQELIGGSDVWKDFTCEVHSLKGETRSFGAKQLGEMFYHLEQLAVNREMQMIKEEYENTVGEWDAFVSIIRTYAFSTE